jgi:hypothetical protein
VVSVRAVAQSRELRWTFGSISINYKLCDWDLPRGLPVTLIQEAMGLLKWPKSRIWLRGHSSQLG